MQRFRKPSRIHFATICLLAAVGVFVFWRTAFAYPDPTISIQPSATVAEAAGSVTLTVTLSESSASTVTVNFATGAAGDSATSPADYTNTSGTLTFPSGTLTQTITVPIIDDALGENSESFTVTLSNATNSLIANGSCTVIITDNDGGGGGPPELPSVSFSSATYSIGEGAGSIDITVTLSAAAASEVKVNYATADGLIPNGATAGSDYTATSGTLTIPAGVTSKTFSVAILNDAIFEGSETVRLTLSAPSTNAALGTPSSATLTILDDEPPPPPLLTVSCTPTAICAGAKNNLPHQTIITATLKNGVIPLADETISFSTTSGTLSASVAQTDANGQAQITLTSGIKASEPGYVMLATVTAEAGGVAANCTVEFQPTIATLSATPGTAMLGESIGLTAGLSWNGQPMPEHALSWRISRVWDENANLIYDGTGQAPSNYGAFLAGAAAETDFNGAGTAVFRAGSLPGKIELKVADESITFVNSGDHPSAVVQVTVQNLPGVKLQEVSFSGGNHALISDLGMPFAAPQWSPFRSFPAAYTRNTVISASAVVVMNPPLPSGTMVKIKGVSSLAGIEFPARDVLCSGSSQVTYPPTAATALLLDKIQHIESFKITWSVALGEQPYQTAGTSDNTLYVTWTDPADSPTFHTVIHLGCVAAEGADGQAGGAEDEKVLEAIWGEFKKKSIKKAPDDKFLKPSPPATNYILTYYGYTDVNMNKKWDGPPDKDCNLSYGHPTAGSLAGLLQTGNGDCGIWVDFMRRCLHAQFKSQKINGEDLMRANITIDTKAQPGMEYFAAQNWNKTAKGPPWKIIGEDTEGNKNNSWNAGVDGAPGSVGYTGRTVDENLAEAADKQGTAGQGTSPNPPSRFPAHTIFMYKGKYYDPSYGVGPFEGKDAMFADQERKFLYEKSMFEGPIVDMDKEGRWLKALPAMNAQGATPEIRYPTICKYTEQTYNLP